MNKIEYINLRIAELSASRNEALKHRDSWSYQFASNLLAAQIAALDSRARTMTDEADEAEYEQWKPISEFDLEDPKNFGKHILGYLPVSKCSFTLMWWASKHEKNTTPRWQYVGGEGDVPEYDHPTYFMNLPSPPLGA